MNQLRGLQGSYFDTSDAVPVCIDDVPTTNFSPPGNSTPVKDGKIAQAAKKAPLDMVPLRSLKGAARVLRYGTKKYRTQGNFLSATLGDGAGGRYHGAALRHLSECQEPSGVFSVESLAAIDDESGLPHIDHMICGLLMLRAILVKDGALPEDPGEGNEPPVVTL